MQDAVRDHDHGPASVREQPQLSHDLLVQGGVQAGGRFVEGEQRRLGQQLQRDRRALALAAGERVDPLFGAVGQSEQLDDLGDSFLALLSRHVAREAQRGGEAQCPADSQLAVQYVVLRHQTDPIAQLGVVLIQVLRVVKELALGRLTEPRHALEERGLPQPLGPMIPSRVPWRSAKLTSSRRIAFLT